MIREREDWASALHQMYDILDAVQFLYPECTIVIEEAHKYISSMYKTSPHPRAVPREYAKSMLLLRKSILQVCSMLKCAPIEILKLTQYESYSITVLQSQLYLLCVALLSKKRAMRELTSMLAYDSKIGCLTATQYVSVIKKYALVRCTYTNDTVPKDIKYLIDFCGIAENLEQLRIPVQGLLKQVLLPILQEYNIAYDSSKQFSYYMKFFNCVPELQPLFVYCDDDSLLVDWWMFFEKFLNVLYDPEKLTPLLTRPSIVDHVQPAMLGMLDAWTVLRLQIQRESHTDISHKILGDIFHDVLMYTKLYRSYTDSIWKIEEISSQKIWDIIEQLSICEECKLPYNRPSDNIVEYVKRLELQPAVTLLSDLFVATSIPGTLRHDVLTSDYTDAALNYYALYGDTPSWLKAKYKNNMFGYLNDLIQERNEL